MRERLASLRDELAESRTTLHLEPDRVERVVSTALELARQPALLPGPEPGTYAVPALTRINAVLHRMAITQLRCEPRAQAIYANARKRGHTKKEARRVLKRHLSDVVYRRMIRDQASLLAQPLLAA